MTDREINCARCYKEIEETDDKQHIDFDGYIQLVCADCYHAILEEKRIEGGK